MAHIHELIDLTVSCYVVYDDKVLLAHHKKYNKWLQIGGHVELNQNTDEALENEIREEAGLEVEILGSNPNISTETFKSLRRPESVNIHYVSPTHQHLDLVYYGRAKTAIFQVSDEHYELRWFSLRDLDNPEFNIQPQIKYYAEAAIATANSAL
ncbi:MAG: NUDIX hydrolase [Candidatus Saccharimonadia bacterium]